MAVPDNARLKHVVPSRSPAASTRVVDRYGLCARFFDERVSDVRSPCYLTLSGCARGGALVPERTYAVGVRQEKMCHSAVPHSESEHVEIVAVLASQAFWHISPRFLLDPQAGDFSGPADIWRMVVSRCGKDLKVTVVLRG